MRAVTGLSASLAIGTTAEGVETQEQYDRVKDEGCTEVQGLFTGAPMAIEEMLALLGDTADKVSAA